MIAIPVVIGLIGFFSTLFAGSRNSARTAILSTFVLAVLVPSNLKGNIILLASLIGAFACLGAWAVRGGRSIGAIRPPGWIVAYILYAGAVDYYSSTTRFRLIVVTGALVHLILVYASASQSATDRLRTYKAIVSLIAIEVVLAGSETFLHRKALWPRPDGTDVLDDRHNALIPSLPGRALGSISAPIPLGFFGAFVLVVSLALLIRYRTWQAAVWAGLSIITILMSGTRSAVLVAAIVVVLWALIAGWKRRPMQATIAVASIILFLITIQFKKLLGFENFTSSGSYTHRAEFGSNLHVILTRPIGDLLIGTGNASITPLFQSGRIGSLDGTVVFDEEFLRTICASGLIGLALLFVALIGGMRRGTLIDRLSISVIVFSFLTFDTLTWNLMVCILLYSASSRRSKAVDEKEGRQSTPTQVPSSRNDLEPAIMSMYAPSAGDPRFTV